MRSIKKKVTGVAMAIGLGLGMTVATVSPAQAFSTVEMHQACRLANYGHDQGSILWTAQLTYPEQGVTDGAATSTTLPGLRGTTPSTH